MTGQTILLIGATGFIGGSVLNRVLNSSHPQLRSASVSALVRDPSQGEALAKIGVKPILFKSLDDVDVLELVAGDYDVVVHCADGFHGPSAQALIKGLGRRGKETGRQVSYIRTSGTSSVADRRMSKRYVETRELSDKEHMYAYEQYRESLESYPSRQADIATVDAGERLGVKTYIIMSPLIYGRGDGLFNQKSMQIPAIIKSAREWGYVGYVGDGLGEWDHVHVLDLAMLYELLLANIVSGSEIPSGKAGIFFSGTGRHKWLDLAKGLAAVGLSLRALKSDEAKEISVEQAAGDWTSGFIDFVELGYGSRSTTRADVARELGWKPQKTEADWLEGFVEEWQD